MLLVCGFDALILWLGLGSHLATRDISRYLDGGRDFVLTGWTGTLSMGVPIVRSLDP